MPPGFRALAAELDLHTARRAKLEAVMIEIEIAEAVVETKAVMIVMIEIEIAETVVETKVVETEAVEIAKAVTTPSTMTSMSSKT